MKIEKSTIDELKQKHGRIYKSHAEWIDENGKSNEIDFIYRRPTVADVERFNREAAKSPIPAQQNFFVDLVVYPESSTLVKQIGDNITVYSEFVNNTNRFFGQQAKITDQEM